MTSPLSSPEAPRSPETPRIALLCDWLTEPGGAEKVLLELHHMYPDAPIYTSQYRKKRIDWFKDAKVKTGWLNLFPVKLRKVLGPLRQSYFSHLNLSKYDLVISVTGAEAKAIRLRPRTYDSRATSRREVLLPPLPQPVHLCYCHAPTQYYWGKYQDYLKNPGFGKLDGVARFFLKLFIRPLRHKDFKSAARPDQFITISRASAEEIEKYYEREAVIVAPPVDFHKFSTPSTAFSTAKGELPTSFPQDFHSTTPVRPASPAPSLKSSFVIACRQVTWKRVDLAILACLKANKPLVVIGSGPEHDHLVELAAGSPLITFVPWLDSDQLAYYLQNCRAYLFPSREPFGIAAVEALAAGCPVIAYLEGGSKDFIHPGQNGLLFREQTVDSLASAIAEFEQAQFNREKVSASAAIYDVEYFRSDIKALVDHYSSEFLRVAPSEPLPSAKPLKSVKPIKPSKSSEAADKSTNKNTKDQNGKVAKNSL